WQRSSGRRRRIRRRRRRPRSRRWLRSVRPSSDCCVSKAQTWAWPWC
uniref:Uncharacterized protein n=1 Tax=Aegilops tauschii subsp. strangulata TaxID=200361 RepID=A0A453QNQ7_AEGTS